MTISGTRREEGTLHTAMTIRGFVKASTVDEIVDLLRDPQVATDYDLRAVLYRATSKRFGDDPLAAPVYIALTRDSDPALRAIAARKLGVTGGDGAFEALASVADDADEGARNLAVAALATVDPGESITIAEHALTDESALVRGSACKVLGAAGDPSSVAPLKKALADSTGRVRGKAATALAAIGTADAAEALLSAADGARVMDRLIFKDQARQVRERL